MVYADHHVYPYTYLGCFMFRSQRFTEAIHCYANAAQVIRNFNYGREDEEIYKEFMEVNNEIIPQLVRYPGEWRDRSKRECCPASPTLDDLISHDSSKRPMCRL